MSEVLQSLFLLYAQVEIKQNILKLRCRPLDFTLYKAFTLCIIIAINMISLYAKPSIDKSSGHKNRIYCDNHLSLFNIFLSHITFEKYSRP